MIMLCKNRPEGFGPESHLFPHILTSCFLDTILVPICTWLYLLIILALFLRTARGRHTPGTSREYTPGVGFKRKKSSKIDGAAYGEAEGSADSPLQERTNKHNGTRAKLVLKVLYFLLLLAQFLMCILEITRLSLANLGIGLLPFTLVTLVLAGLLRISSGLMGRVDGWLWANLVAWIALAVCNGVKIAEEVKEGINTRKGTKYPESDEVIDVAVMVGVYSALAVLEILLGR